MRALNRFRIPCASLSMLALVTVLWGSTAADASPALLDGPSAVERAPAVQGLATPDFALGREIVAPAVADAP